ncbi:MAG: hypothetical protein KatS3mg090_1021 [Patescibacteria group bacterium]|nr:MAG: hypothetical protein KatS3mg090_1021 [Patescibacteria group bacterium]
MKNIYLIPSIIVLNQVLKEVGVPSRFIPLVNILMGVVAMVLIEGFSVETVLEGIVVGGAAGGLYDLKKIKKI